MIQVNKGLPSNQSHSFAKTSQANIDRSVFDRSHTWKGTAEAGKLIPVYMDEMLPGDTFQMQTSHVIQMQPIKVGILDNLYVDCHYFFVPNRLIWTNWEKSQGQQDSPGDSIDFLAPVVSWLNADGKIGHDSLYADLGWPQITPTVALTKSAMPFRAIYKAGNDWYRDENLQNQFYTATGDGPDVRANYVRLPRGKRHDYFTSCLPWAQKGTAISLPLGTSAPVLGIAKNNQTWITGPSAGVYETGASGTTTYAKYTSIDPASASTGFTVEEDASNAGFPAIYADLSDATAATINDLRFSNMVQELLELDARGGTRYTEIIRAHFGVTSPDARLQRAEFLGGWSEPITTSLVPMTNGSSGANYQAQLSAFARSGGKNHGFTYSATEHGFVFALMSIRGDLNYQQGIDKMWSRRSRYDWYMPVLGHLGEQEVPNHEIYAIGDDGTQDDATFGWQEAWADLRFKKSIITGLLNSDATGTLDQYHIAQDFASLPTLNSTFIEEDPAIDRIVAITSEPPFILDVYHNLKCTRPVPVYSIPQLASRM